MAIIYRTNFHSTLIFLVDRISRVQAIWMKFEQPTLLQLQITCSYVATHGCNFNQQF